MCGHPLLQVLTFEVFHGEERLPLVVPEIVDGDDVLVGELAGGAGFAKETLADFLTRFEVGDELDGDHALEQRVEGAVDDTHAALTELFDELVASNRVHSG